MRTLISDSHFASRCALTRSTYRRKVPLPASSMQVLGPEVCREAGSCQLGRRVRTCSRKCPACCLSRHCGLALTPCWEPDAMWYLCCGQVFRRGLLFRDCFVPFCYTNGFQAIRKTRAGAFASTAFPGVSQRKSSAKNVGRRRNLVRPCLTVRCTTCLCKSIHAEDIGY